MNIPIEIVPTSDVATALLLMAFFPMICTAVMSVLLCWRTGYSKIGFVLCFGFLTLVVSLWFGLMYNIQDIKTPILQIIAGITRIIGWTGVATALVLWFLEVDKGLP